MFVYQLDIPDVLHVLHLDFRTHVLIRSPAATVGFGVLPGLQWAIPLPF